MIHALLYVNIKRPLLYKKHACRRQNFPKVSEFLWIFSNYFSIFVSVQILSKHSIFTLHHGEPFTATIVMIINRNCYSNYTACLHCVPLCIEPVLYMSNCTMLEYICQGQNSEKHVHFSTILFFLEMQN